MTDINLPEVSPPQGTVNKQERDVKRQAQVEATINEWSSLSPADLFERVRRLKFIVDPWATLDEYADLTLQGGYILESTSRSSSTPGTITLGHSTAEVARRIRRSIKTYANNHGLTLAQADTFITTLYFAKFSLLPLLLTVLNDKALYNAYRSYSRDLTREEYFQWIKKNNLQNSAFNVSLTPVERARLSDLLERMVRADKVLRPTREKYRVKHAMEKTA